MKKIEITWRELLFQAIEKGNRQFTQKELAEKFGFSTSTIFQALKVPRKMGAVRVTGRFFVLEYPEKLLYHWASTRDLKKDILFTGKVKLPVLEIEGRMPPEVVFGGFSAARLILKEPPADYDKIYVYTSKPEAIKKRFELEKALPASRQGNENLIVLKTDPFLGNYGQITTLGQTFVDLWSLPEWYAKEFTKSLKERIDARFLS
ncbi:MAG TPA: hypothetical protein VMW41_00125 [Candidatus Bathyarchaeia archaeon]|nr:hypothetical protein [Candidatus Bathyarchaeia archaeon]